MYGHKTFLLISLHFTINLNSALNDLNLLELVILCINLDLSCIVNVNIAGSAGLALDVLEMINMHE